MQFQIDNMTCDGCVRSLTRAITRLDAAAEVNADLATKKVSVASERPQAEIVAALTDAGFPPVAA